MLVCKTAGHDSDHRPGDHGLVVVREPFVVADGTAVFGDPGDGALHHPSAGQNLEGVGQASVDNVDPHAQAGGRPGDQLAGIGGISPDQTDATAGSAQLP
jgi:hypothetical protein